MMPIFNNCKEVYTFFIALKIYSDMFHNFKFSL